MWRNTSLNIAGPLSGRARTKVRAPSPPTNSTTGMTVRDSVSPHGPWSGLTAEGTPRDTAVCEGAAKGMLGQLACWGASTADRSRDPAPRGLKHAGKDWPLAVDGLSEVPPATMTDTGPGGQQIEFPTASHNHCPETESSHRGLLPL